jgi:hypothetical protein
MIRLGNHNDINQIIEIGKSVIDRSLTFDCGVDSDKAGKVLRRAMSDKKMELFVAVKADQVVGFLLALKDEHWFSRSMYGTDLAFCVDPAHLDQGVWLFRRFKRWCNSQNLPIMMGLSTGMDVSGRTGEMYQTHGLKSVGGIFATVKKQEGEI